MIYYKRKKCEHDEGLHRHVRSGRVFVVGGTGNASNAISKAVYQASRIIIMPCEKMFCGETA